MGNNKKYGNIYELKLPNEKYVYICWVEECSFAVFDYYSEKPVDNIKNYNLKDLKFLKKVKKQPLEKKYGK